MIQLPKSKLLRSILGVGSLKIIAIPLTFFLSIILARILGPSSYGSYVFITTLMWALTLIVGPGIGQLLTREVAKYFHTEDWPRLSGIKTFSNRLIGVYSILVVSAIVVYAYWNIESWIGYLWGALTIPLVGWTYAKASILRGLGSAVLSQIPEMIVKSSVTILLVVGFWLFTEVSFELALFAQAGACGFSLLLCHYFLARIFPRQSGAIVPQYSQREWFAALLPFSLIAAVSMLNNAIGVLILGTLGNDEAVAVLKIAQTGSIMVSTALVVVHQVIAPEITKAKANSDQQQLKSLFKDSARLTTIIAVPVSIPLIFFGEPLISVLYGVEFGADVALPLAILSIGQLLNVSFGLVGLFLSMSGFEKDSLTGQIIALLSNIVLCFTLIPSMGSVGAAYAISISTLIWNLVLGYQMHKRLKILPGPF